MRVPGKTEAAQRVAEQIGRLLSMRMEGPHEAPGGHSDFIISAAPHRFNVEWRSSGSAYSVAMAIEQIQQYMSDLGEGDIPLVAVPFMGKSGRERCEQAGVAWLDLSGNLRINAPGLLLHVEGRPNSYRHTGRPPDLFAPKSSRIARCFLANPTRSYSHTKIVAATKVDRGQVSRVLREYVRSGLAERDNDGMYHVDRPGLLLDAWRDSYDFSRHHVIKGHLTASTGVSRTLKLAEALTQLGFEYAATGLSAAWVYSHFATFRTATVYVSAPLKPEMLESFGFREEERGSNAWLVWPVDEGVFDGTAVREGIVVVSPLQAYLDLAAQPERASEAGEHLRAELLGWSVGDS